MAELDLPGRRRRGLPARPDPTGPGGAGERRRPVHDQHLAVIALEIEPLQRRPHRRRIESHRLQNGDELQVGKYKLTYLDER